MLSRCLTPLILVVCSCSLGCASQSVGESAGVTASQANETTPARLQERLEVALLQLQALQLQVDELRQHAANHSHQLALLQGSGPQDRALASQGPGASHYLTQSALRASSSGHSAWLDSFLLLALLKAPSTDSGPTDPAASDASAAADAAKLQGVRVTTVAPLHVDMPQAAGERTPRYIALGLSDGSVAVYTVRGALVLQISTGSDSPVTALASYPVRRNESALITGHQSGELRAFTLLRATAARDGANTVPSGTLQKAVLRFAVPPGTNREGFLPQEPQPIQHIYPTKVTGRHIPRRQVAVWDASGWLRLVRENGTVRVAAHGNHSMLAASQSGQNLISLSDTRAYTHRQMPTSPYRIVNCTLLNGTRMIAATFDPVRPHRAYAVNDAGQLLLMSVPHDTRTTTCKVVRAYPLQHQIMPPSYPCAPTTPNAHCIAHQHLPTHPADPHTHTPNTPQDSSPKIQSVTSVSEGSEKVREGSVSVTCVCYGRVSLVALRGYVVMVHARGGAVFNVTSLRAPVGNAIVAEGWSTLADTLGVPHPPAPTEDTIAQQHHDQHELHTQSLSPLLSATIAGSGLLLLGVGDSGRVAVMESELYVSELLNNAGTQPQKSFFAHPLLMGVVMLVGVWQFMKIRNRGSINLSNMDPGPPGSMYAGRRGIPGAQRGGGGDGAYKGMPPTAQAAYAAALEQMKRDRAAKQGRGGRAGTFGMADDDDSEEEELFNAAVDKKRGQARGGVNKGYAGSGFAGPRSMQRGMRMGIPPIVEHEEEQEPVAQQQTDRQAELNRQEPDR